MPDTIFINGRFLTQKLTGVQRYAYEITKRFLEKGVQVKIVMPPKPIFEGYSTEGWPIIKCGFMGGHLWEQFLLPLYLLSAKRRTKNKILINFCNTAPVFFDRNILALHDISFVDHPQWFKKTFVLFYKLIIPHIIRRSISIITVSQFSKQRIEMIYPSAKGKVKVIHSACASSTYKPAENNDCVLNQYKLKKNNFILSVCSIEPRKNLTMLIKAFAELKNENIDLVLVGSGGSAFAKMILNTEGNHRIKFTGYIPEAELQCLYENALCFCYPSLYEGFGLPPLEAMARSCPVVASKLPSLQEVCGDASLYVDPYDHNSIASAIWKIINDEFLRSLLVRKGLENVKKFTWELTTTSALKEIQEVK